MRVREIWTFPRRREPGVQHHEVGVGVSGVDRDRPKKAPVSVVGNDVPGTRANLVLDRPTAEVELLGGAVLRVGQVLLAVERTDNACPGLYASVGAEGRVRVGDRVHVVTGSGAASGGVERDGAGVSE